MKNQLTKRMILMVGILAVLGVASSSVVLSTTASAQSIPSRYIVVLNDDIGDPNSVANEMAKEHGLSVILVYKYALKGYNAIIPASKLDKVENDPRVSYVEKDREVFLLNPPPHNHGKGGDSGDSVQPPQELPTGIDRINADLSSIAAGDGAGNNVDVDVAIIDTGIDTKHPDLNVINHARCSGTGPNKDQNGHGTHVAGTIGALDNDIGVVGVAPGAKLWGVKVLDAFGSGTLGCVLAGVDYVTQHADEIEVANMSLGFEGTSPTFDLAIANSVGAGVTYVVAASNDAKELVTTNLTEDPNKIIISPANHPDVITVSAIADFDGVGGGLTDTTVHFRDCSEFDDDSFACFSNYGSLIELTAPGVNILSTWLDGGYNTISGTSMASPHVAGAAALYLSNNAGATPATVKAALIAAGSFNWDNSDDGDLIKEPLVDVSGF